MSNSDRQTNSSGDMGVSKIFGFRSKKVPNMLIACFYYGTCLTMMIRGLQGEAPEMFISGLFYMSPMLVLHDSFRDKLPFFKKRKWQSSAIGFLIILILMSIVSYPFAGGLM